MMFSSIVYSIVKACTASDVAKSSWHLQWLFTVHINNLLKQHRQQCWYQ